jgi:hypothetical protein
VKVPVVLPADTVTLPGRVAFVELLASLTTKPPVGARPLKVTVPVEEAPPVTLVGFKPTETREAGFTVKVADSEEL